MGIRKEEECFPRGRSSSTKPALRKTKDSLFKKHKRPKKKSKKTTFTDGSGSKDKSQKKALQLNVVKHVIKALTYQTLEEGMVVVGRIREIWPYHMFVCLPGRLSAKVHMSAISEPYTDSLNKLKELEINQQECPSLSELFRVGETVVCSVLEVRRESSLLAVTVTLEPELVNKERGHHSLRAGHCLAAAVHTVEDHGYTLHTGVRGLTAFLHTAAAHQYVQTHNHGRPLAVGEVVWCLVTKCATGKSASRVEVTLDPDLVAGAVLRDKQVTPQTLQPAATVSCTVDRVLGNRGLVVAVGRGKGYIEASQLSDCWSIPKYYQPQTELTASVLYTCTQSNFQMGFRPTFLTLKPLRQAITPHLPLGQQMQAKVTNSGPRGVYLCLGDEKNDELGNKGFVSVRRLGEDVVKEKVAVKFPKGKLVTTTILAFDYMEQVYNCSLERNKLEQQFVKVDQLSVGDRVTCQVTAVEENCLRLAVGNVALCAFKEHSADVPYSDLHAHFGTGDIVDARVLKVCPELRQVTVTLKETLIRCPALMSYAEARLGNGYWATVRFARKNSLLVNFYSDVTGRVHLPMSSPTFSPGHLVKCYVAYVNVQEEKLLLSLKPEHPVQPPQLTVGQLYQLVVTDTGTDHYSVSACDFDDIEGLVPKVHLQDKNQYAEGDFLKAWFYLRKAGMNHFSPNPAIQDFFKDENITSLTRLTCCVMKIESKKISVLTSVPQFPVVAIPKSKWPDDEKVEVHQIVELYVEKFDPNSSLLVLARELPKTPLGSTELKDTKSSSADKGKKIKNDRKPNMQEDSTFEDSVDARTSDSVEIHSSKKKERESKVSHLEESEDKESIKKGRNSSKSGTTLQEEIKRMEEEISKINKTKKKKKNEIVSNTISGNKESLQSVQGISESEEGGQSADEENSLSNNKTPVKRQKSECDGDLDTKRKAKKQKQNVSDTNLTDANKNAIKKATLSEAGFLWDVKPEDLMKPAEESVEDIDEDAEDTTKGKKKKTAAERRRVAKEEEARLREVERTLLDSESNPQSVDQFDRAVLARPDDADLWIKYMSHHLQATEIEKARAVARRALQTINQRHEVDRLNVWIALLNLEHLFGTQESLKTTLDEALRTNDEYTVYCKMLNIYSEADKSQEAEQLVNTMVRKFRSSAECWLQGCSALMKCQLPDKARNLLQRSISTLPTKEHVNLLCKFALLENQCGFSEQAQTLFEHILTSYPKRTDVWKVYVDMLVKADKIQVARQILERAARQRLPPRKMKVLFGKWVSFEEKHGTPEKVEHVRKQAFAYVNNISLKLEDT